MVEKDAQHRRRGRDATTAAILDAAEELFHERGYGAVTVRDIAEQAGVSHALVHQYAGSK
ncbi:MAG: helix-turn-helix domain-containing protein, partial [Actinomycetes bacterium]